MQLDLIYYIIITNNKLQTQIVHIIVLYDSIKIQLERFDSKMNFIEKTISREEIFNGKVINVHVDDVVLPNGKISKREVVDHRGGVCIAALTSEDELLFVKQYRYPYKEVIFELPAGKLEGDLDPLENGKRELKEETGAYSENYVYMGKLYPSPGYTGEIIYMYFCKVSGFSDLNPDEDEFLEVCKIPLDEAVNMVLENKIFDAKTQVLVLKVASLKNKGLL